MAARQTAPRGRREFVRLARQPKLSVNLRGSSRQKWPKQYGQQAANLSQIVKHLIQSLRVSWVFGQLERRRVVHVLISARGQRPDRLKRALQTIFLQQGTSL